MGGETLPTNGFDWKPPYKILKLIMVQSKDKPQSINTNYKKTQLDGSQPLRGLLSSGPDFRAIQHAGRPRHATPS
jgi:hypothetical protein